MLFMAVLLGTFPSFVLQFVRDHSAGTVGKA